MEADISTWRKTGHFYFALTRQYEGASPARLVRTRDVDRFLLFNPQVREPDPIRAISSAFLNYRLIRRSFGNFLHCGPADLRFPAGGPLFGKQIKISRTDLYEMVWTTPLRTLAKE
jgi:hypothetical protein